MGFFAKLFGAAKVAPESALDVRSATTAMPPSREVRISYKEDLEVSGEAYHRDGIGGVFHKLGRPAGGVTMQTAYLIPEPDNKYDRHAVKVVVLGEQLGHVGQEASREIARRCAAVGRGNVATVLARVWARNDDGTWRARVTLMFSGEGESEKDYAAEQQAHEDYLAERAKKDAEKAARLAQKEARHAAGEVNGQYWSALKPSISELKRQQRFDEAHTLLVQCVAAAERESTVSGEAPSSWPTEQLSVVLRKLRLYPAELQYLERYAAACGDRNIPEGVLAKLNRSRLIAERDESNA